MQLRVASGVDVTAASEIVSFPDHSRKCGLNCACAVVSCGIETSWFVTIVDRRRIKVAVVRPGEVS